MKSMSSEEIRELWRNYWESSERKHNLLPPAPLVPDFQDKTVLFTGSGMQQLIPNLVGKPHPVGSRLYNVQKCLRTVDIEEVGDHSHHTFFEMMGNWSLGDYFKEGSIKYSIEFLTEYLGLPFEKIAVTVFAGDEEVSRDDVSANVWKEVGIPEHKISYLGKDENWWSPGPVGPCGPDSEIFFRIGPESVPPETSNVKDDEDNWLEIWNNVFMEFYRDEEGNFSKLQQQNVDTGLGFERICMVMQGVSTNYETDLFQGVLEAIGKHTGYNYFEIIKTSEDKTVGTRMRIIADHVRSSAFMIADGVIPSNETRGYILRRLIRRFYYNLYLLKGEGFGEKDVEGFAEDVVNALVQKYGDYRRELSVEKGNIVNILIKEIMNFKNTLNKGLDLLEDILEKRKQEKRIEGEKVFMLYDTYGFPFELTKEIAFSRDFEVDEEGFYQELEKAKERSRQATKDFFKRGIDWSKYLESIPQTQFVGYEDIQVEGSSLLKEIDVEGQKVLVFDKTPFYAESGGQTGDKGKVVLEDGREFEVYDVQDYDGVFLHFVK